MSSCCLHVLQALFDDQANSTDAAAASQLCTAACLEVAAWQQRMPAAAQLMHASMQPRHILMLLAVLRIAEGESMDCASQQLAGVHAATDMRDVQQMLLHHRFTRQDGYTDALLRNSAASCTNNHTEQQGAADQQPVDVASLLVWVARNAATASFLSRVLDIACREGQLAAQVRGAVLSRAFLSHAGDAEGLRCADRLLGPSHVRLPVLSLRPQVDAVQVSLQGIGLALSAARIAGVFMGDFAAVQEQLQAAQQQLPAVWADACHIGLLQSLKSVQGLHEQMLSAAQVGTGTGRTPALCKQRMPCTTYADTLPTHALRILLSAGMPVLSGAAAAPAQHLHPSGAGQHPAGRQPHSSRRSRQALGRCAAETAQPSSVLQPSLPDTCSFPHQRAVPVGSCCGARGRTDPRPGPQLLDGRSWQG